jgi:hypothetical protein
MASKKRWLLRIGLALLISLIGGILFLELGSLWYFDGVPAAEVTISLPPAAVCDPTIYPPDPEKLAALESALEVRRQGRRITPDELEGVLVAAPQADLPYRNGVFCNGMVYISQRLSPPARRYVARHELEHYFQFQGLDGGCQDWELCANWEAAREYPWGLLTTITSSLVEAFRLSPSFWDFLFNAWFAFKFYFLP